MRLGAALVGCVSVSDRRDEDIMGPHRDEGPALLPDGLGGL